MNQWIFYVVGGIIGIPCLHVSAPQPQIPSGIWSNPGCAGQDQQPGLLCAGAVLRAVWMDRAGLWVGRLALPFGLAAGEHSGVWCLGRFLSHTCATEAGLPWQPGHAPVGSVMGTHCCGWFSLKTVQMTPSHLVFYVGCSLIVTISCCSHFMC